MQLANTPTLDAALDLDGSTDSVGSDATTTGGDTDSEL